MLGREKGRSFWNRKARSPKEVRKFAKMRNASDGADASPVTHIRQQITNTSTAGRRSAVSILSCAFCRTPGICVVAAASFRRHRKGAQSARGGSAFHRNLFARGVRFRRPEWGRCVFSFNFVRVGRWAFPRCFFGVDHSAYRGVTPAFVFSLRWLRFACLLVRRIVWLNPVAMRP